MDSAAAVFPSAPLGAIAASLASAALRAASVAGLGVLVALGVPDRPGAEPGPVPLEALVASVAAWASEASGLPLAGSLPPVRRASRDEMARLIYGPGAAPGARVPVAALYDRGNARILVADDWTGGSPRGVSVLVHEIVHHLEAAAGVVADCAAAGEARAYAVQQAWLAGFGQDLQETFGIDGATLRLITTCAHPGRRRR